MIFCLVNTESERYFSLILNISMQVRSPDGSTDVPRVRPRRQVHRGGEAERCPRVSPQQIPQVGHQAEDFPGVEGPTLWETALGQDGQDICAAVEDVLGADGGRGSGRSLGNSVLLEEKVNEFKCLLSCSHIVYFRQVVPNISRVLQYIQRSVYVCGYA